MCLRLLFAPRPPPGFCPWTPLGDFHPPDPLFCPPLANSWLCPWLYLSYFRWGQESEASQFSDEEVAGYSRKTWQYVFIKYSRPTATVFELHKGVGHFMQGRLNLLTPFPSVSHPPDKYSPNLLLRDLFLFISSTGAAPVKTNGMDNK